MRLSARQLRELRAYEPRIVIVDQTPEYRAGEWTEDTAVKYVDRPRVLETRPAD